MHKGGREENELLIVNVLVSASLINLYVDVAVKMNVRFMGRGAALRITGVRCPLEVNQLF